MGNLFPSDKFSFLKYSDDFYISQKLSILGQILGKLLDVWASSSF